MDARWRRRTSSAVLLVLFALLLVRTVRRAEPVHNWDALGYMALALEWEEDDPVEVHRRTYEAAREELAPEVFAGLVAPGVRRARYEDPAAFTEHLPFYRARVLYTLLVYALHRAGAPLSAAPWWISLAAFFATGVLILAWAARHLPLPLAVLLAAGLALSPPLLTTAGYATADGLAALATCAGIFAFLGRRPAAPVIGASLLTASILARPDSVILVGTLAAAVLALERGPQRPSRRFLAVWVAASAVAYLGVQAFAGAYPWWVLFHISFVEKAVHPAALSTSIDPAVWSAVVGQKIGELPGTGYVANPRGVTGSTFVFLFAALAGLGLALARRLSPTDRAERSAAVLAALLAAFALRWLLFPQIWDRFFLVLYVTVPLVLLGLVVASLRARDGAAEPAA